MPIIRHVLRCGAGFSAHASRPRDCEGECRRSRRCKSCGHQEEYLQKVSDPPHTRCPACGEEALAKMVTAAGFQLKGSGWYATDFKGSGTKSAASTGAKSEGAKPDGAKAESKAESKSESKKDASGSSASGNGPSGG